MSISKKCLLQVVFPPLVNKKTIKKTFGNASNVTHTKYADGTTAMRELELLHVLVTLDNCQLSGTAPHAAQLKLIEL